jgi:hypothetical protein
LIRRQRPHLGGRRDGILVCLTCANFRPTRGFAFDVPGDGGLEIDIIRLPASLGRDLNGAGPGVPGLRRRRRPPRTGLRRAGRAAGVWGGGE